MGSLNHKDTIGMHLVAVAAFFFLGGNSHAGGGDEEEEPGKALVGAWEKDDKITVISADGTGKNHDGSRFRWELKEGRLIARSLAADGKLGEEWSVPIAFTQDQKEYSYLLGGEDGGLKRMTYYKLDREGRRYAGRTEADRAYPPDAEALKGEGPPKGDGDSPAPTVVPQ